MFGKVLTALLVLTFVLAGFSFYLGFSDRARIERIEKSIASQEAEYAPKFQCLANESAKQTTSLGVVNTVAVTAPEQAAKNTEPVASDKLVSVTNFFSHHWWAMAILIFILVILVVVIVAWLIKTKKVKSVIKSPVILLAGIVVFSLAGSVWAADDQKLSVYQGIYDVLNNQNKSISKLSVWQSGFVSAQAILDQAKKYTDQKIAGLPKNAKAKKPVEQNSNLESRLADIEMQLVLLTPKIVPKTPLTDHPLWGEPIVADVAEQPAKKVVEVEVGLQQVCKETDEQKIKRLEQEKLEAQNFIKELQKELEAGATAQETKEVKEEKPQQRSVVSDGRRYTLKFGRVEIKNIATQKEDSK